MMNSRLSNVIYLYLDTNYETENFRWSEIITSEDSWNCRNALLYQSFDHIICVFYIKSGGVVFYETFVKNLCYFFENPDLCKDVLLMWLIDKHIYSPSKIIY